MKGEEEIPAERVGCPWTFFSLFSGLYRDLEAWESFFFSTEKKGPARSTMARERRQKNRWKPASPIYPSVAALVFIVTWVLATV